MMTTHDHELEDLLDRLVSEYSDRAEAGRAEQYADLSIQVPNEHRPGLERCFRMIRAGLASSHGVRPLGPGSMLDDFRIVREIGRGGMAVVYEAVQQELDRLVALKVLRPGLAIDDKHVDRFRREALAVAKIQHPHIVQVFAVGEALGHHYIAMELVQGRTLAETYAALPDERVWTAEHLAQACGVPELATSGATYERALCALLAPVARAIGLAHELGMVHRDVKPSNILIHRDGRAVIADFGLAKGDGDPSLSLTGEPLGTPYYMSPEQAAVIQQPVDRRSDVYSLGVTLYEGLTGTRPFEGQTFYEVLEAIRGHVPRSPRFVRKGVSRAADAVVRKAMAHLPEQRYASALDLSTELAALARGETTRAGAEAGGLYNRLSGPLVELMRVARTGREYRSKASFLGLPLVHINSGPRVPGQPMRRARGWIAIGEIATGVVAIGAISAGFVAFGAVAFGVVTWAALGLGLVNFAGLAIGGLSTGGVAIGVGALGGVGIGVFVHAKRAFGLHTSIEGEEVPDVVQAFFSQWMPWGP